MLPAPRMSLPTAIGLVSGAPGVIGGLLPAQPTTTVRPIRYPRRIQISTKVNERVCAGTNTVNPRRRWDLVIAAGRRRDAERHRDGGGRRGSRRGRTPP